jgi:hypothetical protein
MTEQRHTWTEQELWVVCVCYMEGIPVDVALRLTNTTNRKSMEMRYANCLFLDKGRVDGSLSHASKLHQKVWEEVQDLYTEVKKNTEPVIDYCLGFEYMFGIIAILYLYIAVYAFI